MCRLFRWLFRRVSNEQDEGPETLPFKKDSFFCVAVVKNYARVMHFAANSATLARFA